MYEKELDGPFMSVLRLLHQELVLVVRISAHNSGNMDRDTRIDELDEERRK